MMKSAGFFLMLAIISVLTRADEDVIVRMKQGSICGSTDGCYDKFEGIPYAAPPLGKRRFKAPAPPAHWNGIFYANRTNILCPQIDPFTGKVVGTEDCLVLNIYRKRMCEASTQKQSVMVFIHGGGFTSGHGTMYGVEFLVKHDVVVVTMNYRLGSLGFLCLKTEDIPGNAGLKDQRRALRWVKRNIGFFGGDKRSITIFGESAGAVSVELHTLIIDSSEELFQKGIAESGSALAEWVVDEDPFARVCEVAQFLGASNCDDDTLAVFYQNVDYIKFLEVSGKYDAAYLLQPTYLCIEKHIETAEPFLTDYPANLMKYSAESQVPFISGFNDAEGIYALYLKDRNDSFNRLDQNFTNYLPRDLCFGSNENKSDLAKIIRKFYFGDEKITEKTLKQFVDYITDINFLISIVRSLEVRMKISDAPSYFYEFCYEGRRNLKLYLGLVGEGAAHADELPYLFNSEGFPFPKPISAEDQIIIDRMTTMWTNYAKYGDPTPEVTPLLPVKWTPASPGALDTLIINLNMSTQRRPLHDRIAFWDIIYDNNYCDYDKCKKYIHEKPVLFQSQLYRSKTHP